jgi:RNA polymerase sigma-70 factor (ECF subfamily)
MKGRASGIFEAPASIKIEEEARLVERAQDGDRQAVAELYHRHVDVIFEYTYARVQDAAVAEDLTAQVFLRAIEGLPDYRYKGKPFVSWLYSIARARTADHWRKQHRRDTVPLTDSIPADSPQPEEIAEVESEWVAAIGLLAHLTDDQQDVLILRFIGEMSLSQVAEILGKTVGAVKSIQHRALAALARLRQRHTLDADEV